MGLRPAKTCRDVKGQAWTRTSRHKPRKSFIKGAPNTKIRQWLMGTRKRFEVEVSLVALKPVFVRDNAIEAARQAANKYLEKKLMHNYYFTLLKYPHSIHREHAALGVAGADRISSGMKAAFGHPKGRMAKVGAGEKFFVVSLREADVRVAKDALMRARLKLSGYYDIVVRDIRNDPENLKRPLEGTAIVSVVVEVAPKPEAAPKVEAKEGEAAAPEGEAKSATGDAKPAAGKKEEKKK